MTEMTRSIIDKLNGFEITQKRVFILTRPSTAYPRGKFYNGVVRFCTPEKGCVSIVDDIDGLVEIYFGEIATPTDIRESRKV